MWLKFCCPFQSPGAKGKLFLPFKELFSTAYGKAVLDDDQVSRRLTLKSFTYSNEESHSLLFIKLSIRAKPSNLPAHLPIFLRYSPCTLISRCCRSLKQLAKK